MYCYALEQLIGGHAYMWTIKTIFCTVVSIYRNEKSCIIVTQVCIEACLVVYGMLSMYLGVT